MSATKDIKKMAKKKNEAVEVVETSEAPKSNRGAKKGPVLVYKTPTELGELIGYETKIGVSKKGILAAVAASRNTDLAAELGL